MQTVRTLAGGERDLPFLPIALSVGVDRFKPAEEQNWRARSEGPLFIV